MITTLAGGVGGARFADGLVQAAGADSVIVVVNTADDFELYGLRISPDLDTVLYTLAGLANPVLGWGIADDTRGDAGWDCRLWRGALVPARRPRFRHAYPAHRLAARRRFTFRSHR